MALSIKYKINFIQVLLATMSLLSYCLPLQAQSGQRFKQINYNYDLISGKVNEVHYQASQPDAFYHKYGYDADNRITKVYTSKDNIIWDQDASYTYYAHGPLARAELGDNKVQGMDYAYTLQGWIKGVNSNLLKAENDIGNDGLSGSAHSRVAKDAFGYSLNYYTNDYQAINTSKWSNTVQRFEALTPNSDLLAARFDLYNGNISSMVTTIVEPKVYTGAANEVPNILPQGTAYQYDQLNRLLEMKAFQNLDVATNTWKQGSTYTGLNHNTFKYDANGNVLGQFRANQTGKVIDSLTYKYAKDALGHTKQNRLYHVKDQVNLLAFADDIDDQGPSNTDYKTANNGSNNYTYDEIGNLSSDKQEGIAKIEWTVYGKIKRITRTLGNLRSDLEFQDDASGNRIAKIEKPRDANGLKPASEWIATYYARDAQGNVMGIYKHRPLTVGPSFKAIERNIFGSSRLGSDYSEVELINALPVANPLIRVLGNKHFEGSNHLGNVLAVASDRKIPRDDDGDGVIEYFQAEVLSANDYSPFGVVLDGRSFGISGRYGFNGKEKDDEISENVDQYDYGFRIYSPDLGRFLSIDPISREYPMLTPYQFSNNRPIDGIDLDGLEYVSYTITVRDGIVTSIEKVTDYDLSNNGTQKPGSKKAGKLYTYVYQDKDGMEIGRIAEFKKNKGNDYGIYGGDNNPMIPEVGGSPTQLVRDFSLEPIDEYDEKYKEHDLAFHQGNVEGKKGTFKNPKAFQPNEDLVDGLKEIRDKRKRGEKDERTGNDYSKKGNRFALKAAFLFKYIVRKNQKEARRNSQESHMNVRNL